MITWYKTNNSVVVPTDWADWLELPWHVCVLERDGRGYTYGTETIFISHEIEKIIFPTYDVYESFIKSEIGKVIMPCLNNPNGIEIEQNFYIKMKLKTLIVL